MRTLTSVALAAAGGWWLWRKSTTTASTFKDQSILILGGSRGLGLELARLLVKEGAALTLAARDADELKQAREELLQFGGTVQTTVTDVSDPREVERAVSQTVDEYGCLDTVFYVAGMLPVGPWDSWSERDIEESLEVHMWGALSSIAYARPYLRQSQGRIVNIASLGGRIPIPHMLPYSIGKYALVGMSETLQAELAEEGISLTLVCPGPMRTGSTGQGFYRGRAHSEHTWFASLAGVPGASIDSTRAARKIVEGARNRKSLLVFPLTARLADLAHVISPGLFAQAQRWLAHWLPPMPMEPERKRGFEDPIEGPAELLTRLQKRAAERNNERQPV